MVRQKIKISREISENTILGVVFGVEFENERGGSTTPRGATWEHVGACGKG